MAFKLFRKKEKISQNGFLKKLKKGLEKTRLSFTSRIKGLITFGRRIDEAFLEALEETMYKGDLGPKTTLEIVDRLREVYKDKKIEDTSEILDFLKDELQKSLEEKDSNLILADVPPTVILVAGVNGTGKTTSIAKLAKLLTYEGKKVLLCASDTFRAAAAEQLTIWAERIGVDIIKHKRGGDPAAVTYDALESALRRGKDFLIVDTAGRLHTETGLMRELNKIKRVLGKKIKDAPHEVLLILDATTGQNAIQQALVFKEAIGITGLFLSKLDGTAKGGVVVAIKNRIDIPVKFIGIGETPDDIEKFDAKRFVDALFD